MDPKKTAIVLIEYQNDFVSEGGALHNAVKDVMSTTAMLDNSRAVIEGARARGADIVFVPISFAAGYPEIRAEPYGILKGVIDTSAFRAGSWGAEIVDQLPRSAGDIVIEGKRGLCAFYSTNLDFVLRQRNIETVALAGFLTNCCVESTMRTAYEKGYDVVTLTDCTATVSAEEQKLAVEKNFPMFSRPMTHVEFLRELDGGLRAEARAGGYATA
ncbi:isochorismatase [Sphingomonas oleivorans]|uniref:Isochorismatase n=1 Tax=Sphingomonas oleivorans TaxID=1735121 RepID=A0A2T5G1U9_9SPHN|nr:cysteine hydrolase [Sphingomonas oleivorans]PTQ13115.1 isochorismatase [Sphingomonas oleivorans]